MASGLVDRMRTGDFAEKWIERVLSADAVIALLALGRGKGRNAHNIAPAICGRKFFPIH